MESIFVLIDAHVFFTLPYGGMARQKAWQSKSNRVEGLGKPKAGGVEGGRINWQIAAILPE